MVVTMGRQSFILDETKTGPSGAANANSIPDEHPRISRRPALGNHTSPTPIVDYSTPPQATIHSDHPRLAIWQYAVSPWVSAIDKAVLLLTAEAGGLGDGTYLDLSEKSIRDIQASFSLEYPDLNVRDIIVRHLEHVCRYVIAADRPFAVDDPTPPTTRKPLSAQASLAVFAKDQYRCVHCGSQANLTVDHIVPVVRGGTNNDDNLQTLCRPCNSRKGAR